MGTVKLVPPRNLVINFKPSAKQYELWQLLQPNRCNLCGGPIIQKEIGESRLGATEYKAACANCGNENLPQLILAGGAAGGGKTYLSSCWIISSCIRFPGLRAVVARKTLKSLKESVLNTIKKVLGEWGLVEGENYKINNLDAFIEFWNGSVILMKELVYKPGDDSYTRLGSSEYSIAAVEEANECEEKGVEVLMSRLRWMTDTTFMVPKLLLTSNPTTNWVRSRFVQDDDGNPAKLAEGEFYAPFTVDSNPDASFRRTYIAALNRISDVATRERLRYGNWDFVDTNKAAAYWSFNGNVHLVSNLRERVYDPLKPLVISLDFNIMPFMSSLVVQVDYDNQCIYILDEILGKPDDKENNTPAIAAKISRRLIQERHMGGVVITGDPSGLARSTQTEYGVNNYSIIMDNMHPVLKARKSLLSKQPPQKTRLEFINRILASEKGWTIKIDMRCRRLTEDMVYQRLNADGSKEKKKVSDPKLGVKYEKYGHLSDAMDYAVCLILSDEWRRFLNNGGMPTITTVHNTPVYGDFEY